MTMIYIHIYIYMLYIYIHIYSNSIYKWKYNKGTTHYQRRLRRVARNAPVPGCQSLGSLGSLRRHPTDLPPRHRRYRLEVGSRNSYGFQKWMPKMVAVKSKKENTINKTQKFRMWMIFNVGKTTIRHPPNHHK